MIQIIAVDYWGRQVYTRHYYSEECNKEYVKDKAFDVLRKNRHVEFVLGLQYVERIPMTRESNRVQYGEDISHGCYALFTLKRKHSNAKENEYSPPSG